MDSSEALDTLAAGDATAAATTTTNSATSAGGGNGIAGVATSARGGVTSSGATEAGECNGTGLMQYAVAAEVEPAQGQALRSVPVAATATSEHVLGSTNVACASLAALREAEASELVVRANAKSAFPLANNSQETKQDSAALESDPCTPAAARARADAMTSDGGGHRGSDEALQLPWCGSEAALAALADAFAAAFPPGAVSPAALQGHLLQHRGCPESAVANIGALLAAAQLQAQTACAGDV